MQVMPLLTPTSFLFNAKKRTRSTIDDFESHYLKKRLISTITNSQVTTQDTYRGMEDTLSTQSTQIDDFDNHKMIEDEDMNMTPYSRIHVLDINGTMLPMEQKPGESTFSIPDFVISGTAPINHHQQQLIVYQNKSLFDQLLLQDNSSNEQDNKDEEFESMEVD